MFSIGDHDVLSVLIQRKTLISIVKRSGTISEMSAKRMRHFIFLGEQGKFMLLNILTLQDHEEDETYLGHVVKYKRGPPVPFSLYIAQQLVKHILKIQEQELTSSGSSIRCLTFRLVENLG